MSTENDVARSLGSWLKEDRHEDADRVLDVVFDQIPATPQRRASWLARRFSPMFNRNARFGLAAAAVAVLALIGVNLATSGNGARPTPSPTPTATSSVSPSAQPSPDLFGTQVRDGLLDPGRYAFLDVDRQGFNVSFTVPAGWVWNGRYLSKGGIDGPQGAAIFFYGGPVQVYADPCHWAVPQESMPTGPFDTVVTGALYGQPMRDSQVVLPDRPLGRFSGAQVALTVPSAIDFADCDGGQFRSWGNENDARSNQGPRQIDLVWAVDVPGNGVTNDQGVLVEPIPLGGLIIDKASFPGTPSIVDLELQAILASIYAGYWG